MLTVGITMTIIGVCKGSLPRGNLIERYRPTSVCNTSLKCELGYERDPLKYPCLSRTCDNPYIYEYSSRIVLCLLVTEYMVDKYLLPLKDEVHVQDI